MLPLSQQEGGEWGRGVGGLTRPVAGLFFYANVLPLNLISWFSAPLVSGSYVTRFPLLPSKPAPSLLAQLLWQCIVVVVALRRVRAARQHLHPFGLNTDNPI